MSRTIFHRETKRVRRMNGYSPLQQLRLMASLNWALPISLWSYADTASGTHTFEEIRKWCRANGVPPRVGNQVFDRLRQIGAFRSPRHGVYHQHAIEWEFWVGIKRYQIDDLR